MTELVVDNIQVENNRVGMLHNILEELEHDRCAGWQAYYKADYELDKAVDEIARLKKQIKELKARKK